MPLWSRSRSAKSEWSVARESFASREPASPAGVTGDRSCSQAECHRTDAVQCAYVDRRMRPCSSAVCPGHQTLQRGNAFCARHAATLAAVGIDAPLEARPDIDNSAPALVSWMFRDLHDPVVAVMEAVVDYAGGEAIAIDDLARLVRTPDGRRWSQGWRLIAHTGTVLAVAVEVQEDRPGNITVRVGKRSLVDKVPPWLTQDGDDDPALRHDYLARVIEGIAALADRERQTDREQARLRA
jgi:hypothetical protein